MLNLSPVDFLSEYFQYEPSLFRESDNLHRLLQAIYNVIDSQQRDLLWLAEHLLDLDVAEGWHLDFIGSLVGQPRLLVGFNTDPYFGFEGSYQSSTFGTIYNPEVGGVWNSRSYFDTSTARRLTDEEYKRIIRARVVYNSSNCTSNELLEVLNYITGNTTSTVQIIRHGHISIRADDSTGLLSYFIDKLSSRDNILPIAAGVRVTLNSVTEDVQLADASNELERLVNYYLPSTKATLDNQIHPEDIHPDF